MELKTLNKQTAIDLIKLINSLKGFKKDGTVSYSTKAGAKEYKYIPLDNILEKVKENEDFALMQPLGKDAYGAPCVQCILIHKDGETIVSDYFPLNYKDESSPQDKGSVITYMKRYALASFLGISSETDDDGNQPNLNEDELKKQQEEANKKLKAKFQKEITKIFNQLVTDFGSNAEVYKNIEMSKEEFLLEYNNNPNQLLESLKKYVK